MNYKRNYPFGTMLGFTSLCLACAIFCSCTKEIQNYNPIELQYAIYNNKQNPVTNNQVILDITDESKAELVILGGDGRYSVRNSDYTKLSINNNNGYLTLTPLALGDVELTITDNHNNSYTLRVKIKTPFRVKLNVKSQEGSIFELMEFNLFSYSQEKFTLLDLTEAYDSLVWLCTNNKQKIKLLEHTNNSVHFSWEWSTNFFTPDKYQTVLLGYKNSRIVSSDTVVVNILNSKDFLNYEWNDVVNTSTTSIGYYNIFSNVYSFASRTVVVDENPSIYLFLTNNSNSISNAEFAPKSKQILFDLINSMYYKSTYDNNNSILLMEAYNTFKNREEDATPEYIWITPKSKIALIKRVDQETNYTHYEIYAEPI